MAEWLIAAVLKTVDLRGSGGSNPSLSARREQTKVDKLGESLLSDKLDALGWKSLQGCSWQGLGITKKSLSPKTIYLMPIWSYWVIGALFFVILEVFTPGFAVICFSVGCIAAAICAAVDVSLAWQTVAFAVFSGIALVTIRPLALKYCTPKKKQTRTNADAMVGRKARVTEAIDGVGDTGLVSLDGTEWKAVANEEIAKGEWVVVTEVNSVVLTVAKQ